jgi:hypothetical protein
LLAEVDELAESEGLRARLIKKNGGDHGAV